VARGIKDFAIQVRAYMLDGWDKSDAIPTHRGWEVWQDVLGGGGIPLTLKNAFPRSCMYLTRERRKQRPLRGYDNLHVGAVSRHSLDRLNTSNDFQKKKKKEITSREVYHAFSPAHQAM